MLDQLEQNNQSKKTEMTNGRGKGQTGQEKRIFESGRT